MVVFSVPKDSDRVKKSLELFLDSPRTVCVVCAMLCYLYE